MSRVTRTPQFRVAAIGSSVVILALGLALLIAGVNADAGQDFLFYRDIGLRWLAGNGYYLDRQLGGPYELRLMVDNLYPPTALALFVPTAILPLPISALLWWGVPIAAVSYQLRWADPAPWSWPVLALLAAWPRSGGAVLFGNTDIWVAAGVAAGAIWGWPAWAVTLKPIFAPLALIGIRWRSWWVVGAFGFAASAFLLPEWLRYPEVIRNSGIEFAYSIGSLPLILLPAIAWLARRRPEFTNDERHALAA